MEANVDGKMGATVVDDCNPMGGRTRSKTCATTGQVNQEHDQDHMGIRTFQVEGAPTNAWNGLTWAPQAPLSGANTVTDAEETTPAEDVPFPLQTRTTKTQRFSITTLELLAQEIRFPRLSWAGKASIARTEQHQAVFKGSMNTGSEKPQQSLAENRHKKKGGSIGWRRGYGGPKGRVRDDNKDENLRQMRRAFLGGVWAKILALYASLGCAA